VGSGARVELGWDKGTHILGQRTKEELGKGGWTDGSQRGGGEPEKKHGRT
jgi:hypothetical protein